MKTRILSLLVALAMVFAMTGAFAEGNFNETGLPIVNEKINVTVAVTRHPNDATESYDEKHFVIDAEEQTNIHVTWIEIITDAAERLAVMLAGDMPDAFIGVIGTNHVVQNSNMFLVLTDELLETYCPNVLEYYNAEIEGWRDYLTFPDGKIYGLMGDYYYSYNNSVSGLPFINKEWLDAAGLEIPTTVEELETVLTYFRDHDMDGDGDASNEIPLDFCQAHYAAKIHNFANYWGIGTNVANYAIVDGQVIGNVNTDAYREYLETMHRWVQEGLLNEEGFTMTNDQYTSDLDSMKVGMFYGWAPYTYITAFENQQKYVAMAPVAAEGYTPVVGRSNPARANRTDFVVSASSQYTLEMLRWWDFLSHDQDYAMFVNRGEEGLIYVKGDDGVYYAHTPTEEDLIKFGYEKYAGNIGTSTFAASLGTVNNHPLVKNAIAPDIVNDPTNTTSVRWIAMDLTAPYFQEQYQSKAIVPADVQEEYDFTIDGLSEYINNFAADAVMNGITDESWDAYLAGLADYNYDYYLEWNQKYFDGTLF
jgi:putative aldouronate transport system substrate-binding protein